MVQGHWGKQGEDEPAVVWKIFNVALFSAWLICQIKWTNQKQPKMTLWVTEACFHLLWLRIQIIQKNTYWWTSEKRKHSQVLIWMTNSEEFAVLFEDEIWLFLKRTLIIKSQDITLLNVFFKSNL